MGHDDAHGSGGDAHDHGDGDHPETGSQNSFQVIALAGAAVSSRSGSARSFI